MNNETHLSWSDDIALGVCPRQNLMLDEWANLDF